MSGPAFQWREIRAMRRHLRERARRRDYFPGVDLADPSWDMLLELEVSALEQRRVSVSSLCGAGACPQTTALRHLTRLTDTGWIKRAGDPRDRRREFVELTDRARHALKSYRAGMAQHDRANRQATIRHLFLQIADLLSEERHL